MERIKILKIAGKVILTATIHAIAVTLSKRLWS